METLAESRRPLNLRLLIAVAVAVIAVLAWWLWTRGTVSTDDARVEGRLHNLGARVGGRVVAVHADENDLVRADQVLVEIDPSDYELALRLANAEMLAAEAAARGTTEGLAVSASAVDARLSAAKSSEAGARARLESAEARRRQASAEAERAAKERDRLAPLLAKSEVSQSEFDRVDTAYQATKAALDAATAAVDEARRGIEAAGADVAGANTAPQAKSADRAHADAVTARVEQARAAVDRARLDLERTKVLAPVDGIVGRRGVEVGDQVAAGQPLLGLIGGGGVWVTANFKEGEMARILPGQDVDVHVDAYPGVTFRGKVTSIGAATHGTFSLLPAQNASGNFVKVVQRVPVRIDLVDPPDAAHPLRPGLSVVPKVHVQ